MIKNTFKKTNNKSEQFKFIRTLIDRKFNGAIEGEFRYYNEFLIEIKKDYSTVTDFAKFLG